MGAISQCSEGVPGVFYLLVPRSLFCLVSQMNFVETALGRTSCSNCQSA